MKIILDNNSKLIVQTERGNVVIEQSFDILKDPLLQESFKVKVSFPNEPSIQRAEGFELDY